LVLFGVTTLGCIPMAKPMASSESTLNAPPPPDTSKNATSVLNGTPPVIAPADPPTPSSGQRRVRGAWRWTGTEYRYIPARNESSDAPYQWKRLENTQ
jgi:hypothetical protein